MTAKKDQNKTKREQLIESWKRRADYKGYDKTPGSMFNTWRSIVFNRKGRLIGYPDSWRDFDLFKKDVEDGWFKGMILNRIDAKSPYSKENCHWSQKGTENTHRLATIEYNGETLTLLEIAIRLNLNYNGIRQRFFKGKGMTSEEIIFGKKFGKAKKIKDYKELDSNAKVRAKASKMASQYRLRDWKKGLVGDVDVDHMLKAFESNCIYCGSDKKIGLDRINNSLGHTKENTVPCCYSCNVARSNNFTHEEMFLIGEAISKINKKREDENIGKNT